jgi:hypothetical protein
MVNSTVSINSNTSWLTTPESIVFENDTPVEFSQRSSPNSNSSKTRKKRKKRKSEKKKKGKSEKKKKGKSEKKKKKKKGNTKKSNKSFQQEESELPDKIFKELLSLFLAAKTDMLSGENKLQSTEVVKQKLAAELDAAVNTKQNTVKYLINFIENDIIECLPKHPLAHRDIKTILKINNYILTDKETNKELKDIYINYLYNILLKYHGKIKELSEKRTKNAGIKGGGAGNMLFIILILSAQTFPIFAIQSENIDKTAISKSSVAQYKYQKENADWCNAGNYINTMFPNATDDDLLDHIIENYNDKFTSRMCNMFVSDKELRIASAMNTEIEGAIKDQISIAFGEMSLPQEIYLSLEILGNNGLTNVKDALYETIFNIFTSITNTKDETAKTKMMVYFNGVMDKLKGPLMDFANEIAKSDEFIPQSWVSGALYTVPSLFWNDNREITQEKMIEKTLKAFSSNNKKARDIFGMIIKDKTYGDVEDMLDQYFSMRTNLFAAVLYKMPTLQQTKLLQLLVNVETKTLYVLEKEMMDLTFSKDMMFKNLKDSVSMTTERLRFVYQTTEALWKEANILKDIASGKPGDITLEKSKDSSTIFSLLRGVKDIYDIGMLIAGYKNSLTMA